MQDVSPSSNCLYKFNLLAQLISCKMVKCCLCVCLDVNQGLTNHNRNTQRLLILHAQTYWWTLIRSQKPGRPDLLYWILGHHRETYMCIVSAGYLHTVTKFAAQVHLMWMHQLTDSPPVWPTFWDLDQLIPRCSSICLLYTSPSPRD